jgi:4-diphosphocytidyl-2-C-methyl-D-erythritol kinase
LARTPGGIDVSSDDGSLPAGEANIAYRAAHLVRERYGLKEGIAVRIEKRIPVAAGLGGGSSDAAAVIRGMDRIFGLGMKPADTLSLARELGADVPFFSQDNAWAAGLGIGDEIMPVETPVRLWHILIVPGFPVLSKDAYEWADRSRPAGRDTGMDEMLDALKRGDIDSVGRTMRNDLEGLSLEREGALSGFKERLIAGGAAGAAISGSGPALFGICSGQEEVVKLREAIEGAGATEDRGCSILIARTFHN